MQYNITYREKDKGIQYIISYKDNTGQWKQKSKQGFKKMKEAKAAAQIMADELKEKIETQSKLSDDFRGITFKKFADMYKAHISLHSELNTTSSFQAALKRYSALNDLLIEDVTRIDIQNIVDGQIKEGLNPNTVKVYLSKISKTFKAAKDDYKIILSNPANDIKITKAEKHEVKALTEAETKELLMDFKDSEYYLYYFIAVNTGMRIGEIMGLTWDDIDIKKQIISVNKQWKKNKEGIDGYGKLKSKNSYRDIPISKKTADELLKFKNVISIDKRIFTSMSTGAMSVKLNRLLRKHRIHFHCLRHTYATKLIENGLDFKTVAAILGHDVEQTMRTYSHVTNDMVARAHKLIENIF